MTGIDLNYILGTNSFNVMPKAQLVNLRGRRSTVKHVDIVVE